MTEFMTGATAWLAQHPHWIFLVVCGVAFLESFFVIGVLMPGAVMLFALAGLAGALQLPLLPLLVFAAAGAIAGDVSSFFIGRALEHGMHDRPGFRRWQPQLAAALRFFEKCGVIGIAAGRFVGPARPFLPAVAGAAGMRRDLFIAADCASALAWAPVYILPGYWSMAFAL